MKVANRLGYPFEATENTPTVRTIGLYCGDLSTQFEGAKSWEDSHSLLLASLYAASTRNYRIAILKPWHLQKMNAVTFEGECVGCIIVKNDGAEDLKPLLSAGPCFDLTGKENQYTIGVDVRQATEGVVSHFVRLGHKRLCYVSDSGIGPRFRENSDDILGETLKQGAIAQIVDGPNEAITLLETKRPPTAFWCASDEIARNLWAQFHRKGIHVPKNVSLIGWGNSPQPIGPDFGLTTLSPNWDAMIHQSIDLLEQLAKGRTIKTCHFVTPRLVVRTSTGPLT